MGGAKPLEGKIDYISHQYMSISLYGNVNVDVSKNMKLCILFLIIWSRYFEVRTSMLKASSLGHQRAWEWGVTGVVFYEIVEIWKSKGSW